MESKNEWNSQFGRRAGKGSAEDVLDTGLDKRAEQLFGILQEIECLADDLNDEEFCGLVHQAVTSCGFTDAIDAWFSLLAVTEERIGAIDFRELTPQPPDMRN